MTVIQR